MCCGGGRDTANKYHWHVWGVFAVDGLQRVCHCPRQCVLPEFTLLRLQGALQGHSPKWAVSFVYFPGLSRSCSQVLCRGTDPGGPCILCSSQIQAAQAARCLLSALPQVGHASYSLAWSWPLSFPGALWEHNPWCALCLLWGVDLKL